MFCEKGAADAIDAHATASKTECPRPIRLKLDMTCYACRGKTDGRRGNLEGELAKLWGILISRCAIEVEHMHYTTWSRVSEALNIKA